jgi:enoyl-CoA hydratase/carnithine racemase
MNYETIRMEKDDGIAVLTLDRPDVHNALDNRLRDEFAVAVDAARRDPEIGALIVTGAGERAFCAGLDLREFAQQMRDVSPTAMRRFRWALPHPLATFDKPVIAAVNGLAIGGGVELALLCDITVAADHASFAFAEVRRGIMPGNGGTQRLSRRVGKGRALEMILTGRTVAADEALAIGLVEYVVPRAELMAKALAIGRAIATNAPVAVRMARDAILRGSELSLDEGLRLESDLAAFLYTTEDAREGPLAFTEKRPPRWVGR